MTDIPFLTLMSTYIAPLCAGSAFFALGVNMVFYRYAFQKKAKRIQGRIIAIERYTSTSGSGSDRSSATFYRPIAEYEYKEKTYKCFGNSVNAIRHKFEQTVPILINTTNDGKVNSMFDESTLYLLGFIFTLSGMAALFVYAYFAQGVLPVGLGLLFTTLVSFFGYRIAQAFLSPEKKPALAKLIKQAPDDHDYSHKDNYLLLNTKKMFHDEISKHAFIGKILAYGLCIGSLFLIYAGYNSSPDSLMDIMKTDPFSLINLIQSGSLKSSWEKPLILIGMGMFLFFASLHSIRHVHKNYGRSSL